MHVFKTFGSLKTALAIILLTITVSVYAQSHYEKLPTGDSLAFPYIGPVSYTLNPGKGWYLDRVTANEQGVPFFIYPQKNSDRFLTYIYSSAYPKEGESPLETFIKEDIASYKKQKADLIVKKLGRYESNQKHKGYYYEFRNMPYNKVEQVCFIETPKSIIVISLSTPNEDEYKIYSSFFRALTISFNLLSENTSVHEIEQ